VIEKHSAGLDQRNAARLPLKQLYTQPPIRDREFAYQRVLLRGQSPLSGVAGLRHA
jgi:hypothetical protein